MVDTYIRMKRAEIDIVKEIMAVHTGNAEFRNLKIDVACEKPALHASISYLDGDNLMMFADAIANNIFVFWISKGNDFYTSGFPMQNLLPYAEVTICKYKSLIISVYSSNYGGQILCRGTKEGRKIYKNLQMKLPSKIKYTNICKDVFPVLCIFTFVNTYFCRFLQSLKMV